MSAIDKVLHFFEPMAPDYNHIKKEEEFIKHEEIAEQAVLFSQIEFDQLELEAEEHRQKFEKLLDLANRLRYESNDEQLCDEYDTFVSGL